MMSENLKLPKALTWFALGSGVLCLLYVALFLLGKSFYGACGPRVRGYELWCQCYRPLLFMTASNSGWRYADLDREQWVSVRLESVSDQFLSHDGLALCRFRRADGTCFDSFVRWVTDHDLIPGIGRDYRVKVRVTLQDNGFAEQILGRKGITQWYVSQAVLDVVERDGGFKYGH